MFSSLLFFYLTSYYRIRERDRGSGIEGREVRKPDRDTLERTIIIAVMTTAIYSNWRKYGRVFLIHVARPHNLLDLLVSVIKTLGWICCCKKICVPIAPKMAPKKGLKAFLGRIGLARKLSLVNIVMKRRTGGMATCNMGPV